MGILESIIGSLLGGSNASPGMANVLSSILGGGSPGGMGQTYPGQGNQGPDGQGQGGGFLGDILGGGQSGGNVQGTGGGIGNLISMFEGAGLGHIIQSWIGNGTNSSISPNDLQNVFGDQVPGMAQQAGMEQGDFLNQLSQHLPNAINGMTPDGRVPDNASVNV